MKTSVIILTCLLEKGKSSNESKRMKTSDAGKQSSTMMSMNENTEVNKIKTVPFLLTKVRSIPAEFNKMSLAVGLSGELCNIFLQKQKGKTQKHKGKKGKSIYY